jgi:hypothetical protein
MTVALRPEILSSLRSVREDVQRQVAGLDRYRALQAIDQTIADFPELEDITRSLADIRDRVQSQLDETREYRALRTIERIMPELSEVLALLEEGPASAEATEFERDAEPAFEPVPEFGAVPVAPEPPQPTRGFAAEARHSDIVTFAIYADHRSPETGEADVLDTATPQSDFRARDETVLRHASASDPAPSGSDTVAVPSLADSVAQLMAQSAAPPRDANAPPLPQPQDRGGTAPAQSERAA